MSLYWYVANRDELVAAVVDGLVRGVPTPLPESPWRQQVLEVCQAFRSILYRHRGILAGFAGGITPGPELLRITDAIYGALGEAGFCGQELIHAVDAIGSLTSGFLFGGGGGARSDDDAAGNKDGVVVPTSLRDIDVALLDPRRFPNLVAAGTRQTDSDNDGFNFALEALLDGLELRLERRRSGGAKRGGGQNPRG
jgi:hypothetical protein